MSTVTNIILHTGYDDGAKIRPNIDLLSEWIINEGIGCGPLTQIDQHAWTRGKVMEAKIFGGGFNSIDKDNLLLFFATIPWIEKDTVQLFVKGQEEDRFTLYQFDETGRLIRLHSNYYEPDSISIPELHEFTTQLRKLTDYDRKMIFEKFCTHCGSINPNCTCMRDD